jgi:hypothetical protein
LLQVVSIRQDLRHFPTANILCRYVFGLAPLLLAPIAQHVIVKRYRPRIAAMKAAEAAGPAAATTAATTTGAPFTATGATIATAPTATAAAPAAAGTAAAPTADVTPATATVAAAAMGGAVANAAREEQFMRNSKGAAVASEEDAQGDAKRVSDVIGRGENQA